MDWTLRQSNVSINEDTINRLPQVEYNTQIVMLKGNEAVRQLTSDEAAGSDATPVETYQAGDQPLAEKKNL